MGQEHKRNWLERLVLLLGIILVFTTMAILAYDALTQDDSPANLVLSHDKIQRKHQHYAVHIIAKNEGGETAQDVLVEVSMGEGRSMETARLEFPYLPGKSSVSGWAIFTRDPSNESLTLKILGYGVP
jgi:uncharacterized protein (TIGR02588 family)